MGLPGKVRRWRRVKIADARRNAEQQGLARGSHLRRHVKTARGPRAGAAAAAWRSEADPVRGRWRSRGGEGGGAEQVVAVFQVGEDEIGHIGPADRSEEHTS